MTRDEAIRDRLSQWLKRFNPPKIMEDDPDLQRQEFNALFAALDRYAPQSGFVAAFVDRALDAMEFQMTYRSWPTKGELAKVCEGLSPRVAAVAAGGMDRGDRTQLTMDERQLLETRVLPTARRWVSGMPGISDHAKNTLAFWGEHG